MHSVLSTRRLSVKRGRRRVIHDLDLSIFPGITAILGPNGAGKTTLLTALSRLGEGASGQVLLGERPVAGARDRRTALAGVGFMPQHWSYFPNFTAIDSVSYAAWLKGHTRADSLRAAKEALAEVGLEHVSGLAVRKMSGGMRQRVGLAEAIVGDAPIVLLDEPTVGLDPRQRSEFRQALRARSKQAAIVLSTHLTDDVQALADRVLVLDQGAVVFDGSVDDLSELNEDEASDSPLESGYLATLGSHE